MAQTAILAVGQVAGTSTDVTLAAGVYGNVGIYTDALATPTADTFVLADTGGTLLDSTTYYYRVSAINALGETLAFAEVSQASGTGGNPDEHAITVKWLAVTGATGYRVYGRATGAQELLAEVGAVLEWEDDGSVTPDGALPSANTTAGGIHPAVNVAVYMDTPGKDLHVATLDSRHPVKTLVGPGTWRITRPDVSAYGLNVGIFKEV